MVLRRWRAIDCEQDAWEILESASLRLVEQPTRVTFTGWPSLRLTIKGQDFDSSIPTRVMLPILELQKEIHRIYCRIKYKTDDARSLTQVEREKLELVVGIERGSTHFIIDLAKVLNQIVESSHMSGSQTVILLVAIGLMITSTQAWKSWLKTQEQLHHGEISVKLSQEETERLRLVTEMPPRGELKKALASIDDFRARLSRALKPGDRMDIAGELLIDGEQAARVALSPRAPTREIRVDGEFEIKSMEFPEQSGGIYRLTVNRISDGQPLIVDAEPNVLTKEQIILLSLIFKGNASGSQRVFMEINARQGRSGITGANLVSISWSQAPADDQ